MVLLYTVFRNFSNGFLKGLNFLNKVHFLDQGGTGTPDKKRCPTGGSAVAGKDTDSDVICFLSGIYFIGTQ
jgi:hypothetical protein